MGKALELVKAVSDPTRPGYDPNSPHYDVTADPSSTFFVGPAVGDHKSGDEIRAEVTSAIDQVIGPSGGFLDMLLGPVKDKITQDVYLSRLEDSRHRLTENVELRAPGEPPRTLWANASHEQMVEVINSNADSSVVAVTSEEWVRLGNDLSDHQESFGRAINDSLGNWAGGAGDAARTHLAEVATWLGSTAEGAVLTGRQQEIHSQALNETQRVMAGNPPVPFSAPEANARLARITDPVTFAMQFQVELDTYHQQQAARGQAAQVMQRFDETVAGAAATPRFTAPPTLLRATPRSFSYLGTRTDPTAVRRDGVPAEGDGLVHNSMTTQSAPVGNGTLPNGMPGASIPGSGGQGTPSMRSAAQIPATPDFTRSTFTAPNGVTGPSGFTPLPTTPDVPHTPTTPSGSPGGGGYTPPTFSRPSGPFGADSDRTTWLPAGPPNRPTTPNMPDRQFGPGGVPPVTGGGGPGVGRFGGPGSIPGSGPGGGSGSGPGGGPGGGAPGAGAPGGRGGFGPMGGGGAVSGGAGGVPGAPGGPGVPGGGVAGARGAGAAGMPMGGGGAGRREDDEEYQVASYLEGDSEIFAPGNVVSPPVIGDWNGKHDWK